MDGHVATHIGGVQASTLLTQRMTAKMHRQLVTFDRRRAGGPVRLLPAADHGQDPLQAADGLSGPQHRSKDAGQCCQPYGRTTMIWGAGKEFPVVGRGLRVSDLPQEELLCRRVLRSAPSPRLPARSACSPPRIALAAGAALARRRGHRPRAESPPLPGSDRIGSQPMPAPPRVNPQPRGTSTSKRLPGQARISGSPVRTDHGREPAAHLHHAGHAAREPATARPIRPRAAAPCWCCGASRHNRCARPSRPSAS